MSKKVAVIGDVFLDYVCDLGVVGNEIRLTEDACDSELLLPIGVEVGGAGVQFALAAVDAGFINAVLVGKVGGNSRTASGLDYPADRVATQLSECGVRPLWAVDPSAHTGRAIVLYHHTHRRLMISDPGANATFCEQDLTEQMCRAIETAELLHVSGYALVGLERRAATLRLMNIAKTHGTIVAVDVVPHKIYRQVDGVELLATLRDVDWLIAEFGTARRLLGYRSILGNPQDNAVPILRDMARQFPSVALFINPGQALVTHRGRVEEQRFPVPLGAAARGQSARVQAELLWTCMTEGG